MSSQPQQALSVKPEHLKELREALEAVRKTKIEFDRADVRTAMEHNRQAAAFYEKLCLVNGGTLALSLSLLGPALQYGAGHHLPHRAFLEFVVPAWGLLLISTHFCALRIIASHNMNTKLLERSGSETNQYHFELLKDITQRNANLKIEELQERLQTRIHEIDGHIAEQAALIKTANQEAEKHASKTHITSRLAFGFTVLGIALLCIFAIRVLVAL
jgi:hypothetical protein